MDVAALTVTQVQWDELQPCQHCSQRKNVHMEDGKCLFEASSFAPIPFPTDVAVTTMSWMYDQFHTIKPGPPFPERTKYEIRKDRKLQQRSQRRGR